MRVLAVLAAFALAGCLSFLLPEDDEGFPRGDPGYDAGAITVSSVQQHTYTLASFDGTTLSVLAYEPVTTQSLPNGSVVPWPVVVYLHDWGQAKETWTAVLREQPTPASVNATQPYDVLQATAERGMLAVAYDARGFGQSGASSTLAGAAESADLRAVLDDTHRRFNTTGQAGLVGAGYGGGQALLAASDPTIDAVVAHHGWMDLYDGLVPGDVPKLEWAQTLYAMGLVGSGGTMHPIVTQWYTQFYTRSDLDTVHAQMDERSPRSLGDAPVLLCDGMQDSLFRQADLATHAGTFARARVHMGGQATIDAGCLDLGLAWHDQFLRGLDAGAHRLPMLWTVDALAGDARPVAYERTPVATRTWHLYEGILAAAPSAATFTVSQRLLSNPFTEPGVLSDLIAGPPTGLPAQLRGDPAAVVFRGDPLDGGVVLGRPVVQLVPSGNATYQVVATLEVEHANGVSQILTRGAVADLGAGGDQTITMEWVKADIAPGDRLVLRLAANDPNHYMPLLADYDAVFTGQSTLRVPFFA